MKNKIKIAYMISSLDRQAPVEVLFNTIRHLDRAIFDISVITLKDEPETSRAAEFEKEQVKLFRPVNIGRLNLPALKKYVTKIAEKEKFDIVHSHCLRSLLLNKKGSYISFHTIHSYPGAYMLKRYGTITGTVSNILTKRALRHLDYPVACSESMQKELADKDGISVRYVRNGVAVPGIYENRSELRQELGLDDNYRYIITSGRLSPEKNVAFLAGVFANAAPDNLKLIIMGDGPERGHVQKFASDRVILTGFTTRVMDYLMASDYYVSSSLTEGMPLAALEAMSAGLPLLLSDIAAHREIAAVAPQVVLFENNDPGDFTVKLSRLLENDRDLLGEGVRCSFAENFSSEKMSERYAHMYHEAMKTKVP